MIEAAVGALVTRLPLDYGFATEQRRIRNQRVSEPRPSLVQFTVIIMYKTAVISLMMVIQCIVGTK